MAGPRLRSIIQINPDAVKIASELDNLLSKGKLRAFTWDPSNLKR